eukprot:TRINITY_DN29257_c0_g1_i1.p1 TRINITY_DN29257_c0_g1~~TRINITY_DN29257_c0_g1_i1.p1  ORF type:complete len:1040 (-),score=127.01 TRINITY_DN29257_c0_g1_i1:52-3078(-)
MATDAAPKEPLSKEHFTAHGKACRVFKSQEALKDLHAAATSKGISIEEELKAHDFKNLDSFFLSRPRFSLWCWPSELAELGSGVVLYFHFLSFCMVILTISFLSQTPAIAEYLKAANLDSWTYDVRGFTTEEIGFCSKCLDSNEGSSGMVLGPLGQKSYGKWCKAWDLDWCTQQTSFAKDDKPGKWCCRSWCYVSSDCLTTQDDASPSLSNRYEPDTGLTRSYSACTNSDIPPQCDAGDLSNDIPYPRGSFISSELVQSGFEFFRTTGPGNLGPRNGGSGTVFIANLIMFGLVCFGIIVKHQYQLRIKDKVDLRTVQPDDFAVLVEGLPTTAIDETQIADFFKEHAVEGKTDTEIVKVVICWDSEEFRANSRKMKSLSRRLVASSVASQIPCCGSWIPLESPEVLMAEINEVSKNLRQCAPNMGKRILSSGSAVVIFRHMADLRMCLSKWGPHMLHLIGFHKSNLPLYGRWAKLVAYRAPNPGEIIWEDLGVTRRERAKMFTKTNSIMIGIIILCAGCVYGLNRLKDRLGATSLVWRILPVFGIAFCNTLSMSMSKKYGQEEYHTTQGQQTTSISIKMAVAMLANTAGVIFFTNAQPKEWYKTLVGEVTLLLIFTGTIQPLMMLMDFKYKMNGPLKRSKLTDALLQDLNEQRARLDVAVPTTRDEGMNIYRQRMQIQKQVTKLEQAFEPSDIEMTKKYAYAVRTFLCCMLYTPMAPLMSLVGLIGLGTQYWVDKYMLLRWHKRPSEPLPASQAENSVLFVRCVLAILLPVSMFVFIQASWDDVGACLFWFGIWLFGGIVFLAVPLKVWRSVLCLRFLPGLRGEKFKIHTVDEEKPPDYYLAQHLWPKEMKYHKSQFLYALLPDSKNPEMLTLGVDSATKDSDIRHAVEAGGVVAAAAKMAAHAAGHDDAVAGVLVSPGAAGVSTEAVSELPSGPPPPVWEFETKRGFSPFNDDCQAFIEQKFQEYKEGGRSRVRVVTMGFNVSIDFEKNTQKAGDRGAIRKIQRVEPS